MNENGTYWIGKKARIEILKDGKRLIYTAKIVEIDEAHITFVDRDGETFSFNRELVQEMQFLGGR